jgi:hypothetical protein
MRIHLSIRKTLYPLWIRKKLPISLYPLFLWIGHFSFHTKKVDLVHIHEALDFWAELDLSQRRHIVSKLTVRPH